VDFRDIGNVDCFAEFVLRKYNSLDILINNAAQTIRRPPSFYFHLIPTELKALEDLPDHKNLQSLLLPHCKSWRGISQSSPAQQLEKMKEKMIQDTKSNKMLATLSSISPSAGTNNFTIP
jgi:hypothetical protein